MNDPAKIRNIALVGHRGTGKTSLFEALLFDAGAITRLGSVSDGTTVSDWDDDEKKRQMSLSAGLAHVDRGGLSFNIIDTPGDRASSPTPSPACRSSRPRWSSSTPCSASRSSTSALGPCGGAGPRPRDRLQHAGP